MTEAPFTPEPIVAADNSSVPASDTSANLLKLTRIQDELRNAGIEPTEAEWSSGLRKIEKALDSGNWEEDEHGNLVRPGRNAFSHPINANESTPLSKHNILEQGANIDPRAIALGNVMCKSARIEADSIVTSSILRADAVVEKSELYDANVGSFARITDKSTVKKARVGRYAKVMNSDIADSEIGKHSEVIGGAQIEKSRIDNGATVNGAVLHQTHVGKKARFYGTYAKGARVSKKAVIDNVELRQSSLGGVRIGARTSVTRPKEEDNRDIANVKPGEYGIDGGIKIGRRKYVEVEKNGNITVRRMQAEVRRQR